MWNTTNVETGCHEQQIRVHNSEKKILSFSKDVTTNYSISLSRLVLVIC